MFCNFTSIRVELGCANFVIYNLLSEICHLNDVYLHRNISSLIQPGLFTFQSPHKGHIFVNKHPVHVGIYTFCGANKYVLDEVVPRFAVIFSASSEIVLLICKRCVFTQKSVFDSAK